MPRDLWRKTGEQGYLCPWLPEEYRGLGLGFEYSVIINEELIRGDGFGMGFPPHSDVVTPYIFSQGSDAIKDKWFPSCTTGEVVTAGKTDPQAGYRGISLILVDSNNPGFSRGRKLEKTGYHVQDTAELFYGGAEGPHPIS